MVFDEILDGGNILHTERDTSAFLDKVPAEDSPNAAAEMVRSEHRQRNQSGDSLNGRSDIPVTGRACDAGGFFG